MTHTPHLPAAHDTLLLLPPLGYALQDLAAVSCDELVSYIRDQGAFALRKGLRDMGVTLDSWRSYGGVQCIREATAMFGLKRRVLRMAGESLLGWLPGWDWQDLPQV